MIFEFDCGLFMVMRVLIVLFRFMVELRRSLGCRCFVCIRLSSVG